MGILIIPPNIACEYVAVAIQRILLLVDCIHVEMQVGMFWTINCELTVLVTEWNIHRIRKTANAEAPGGIPEILYCLPDSTGILYMSCIYTSK